MLKLKKYLYFYGKFRQFSTSKTKNFKTVICGSSGAIGEPLGLLLKLNPLIEHITLYDIHRTPGTSEDLSHIDTPAKMCAFHKLEDLPLALQDANIVIITAGAARKPGMSRDDLFVINANVVKSLADNTVMYCPEAFILVVSNPLNSMVPLVSEVYKAAGICIDKKLFGITYLDVVRAKTFISELLHIKPSHVKIDVIGGHCHNSIVPILSKAIPALKLSESELIDLTDLVREAGTTIVHAKEGRGSASLSTAYAISEFVTNLIRGCNGEKDIRTCAYVSVPNCVVPFLAVPIILGKGGIQEHIQLGKLSLMEDMLLKQSYEILKNNIKKGIQFFEEQTQKDKQKTK